LSSTSSSKCADCAKDFNGKYIACLPCLAKRIDEGPKDPEGDCVICGAKTSHEWIGLDADPYCVICFSGFLTEPRYEGLRALYRDKDEDVEIQDGIFADRLKALGIKVRTIAQVAPYDLRESLAIALELETWAFEELLQREELPGVPMGLREAKSRYWKTAMLRLMPDMIPNRTGKIAQVSSSPEYEYERVRDYFGMEREKHPLFPISDDWILICFCASPEVIEDYRVLEEDSESSSIKEMLWGSDDDEKKRGDDAGADGRGSADGLEGESSLQTMAGRQEKGE
jgi:hypothetical protein